MSRTLVVRYAPLLAVVALQVFLVTASDETAVVTAPGVTVGAPVGGVPGVSSPVASATPGAVGSPSGVASTPGVTTGVSGGQPVAAVGSGSSGSGSVSASPTPGAPAPGAAAAQQAPAAGGAQPVDELGRPLDGDRSKCAEGGLLQEDITLQSPPCMPAFEGNNGGATYRGVTGDTIKAVIVYQEYDQGVQQVLAANELAMTQAQAEELNEVLEAFFNTHYEFYGRKIDFVAHLTPASTAIEMRAEAKAIVQQHDPFAVLMYAQGLMPMSLADGLAREQVLTIGAEEVADDFYLERAPYVWSQVIQGNRMVDLAADYYCKRMHGKNATLAGDPAMHVMPRKLGVGSSEDPNELKVAQRFIAQVTGGMCGSPSDDVKLYTFSADPDTAEQQRPALVSRMKNDGITTTYRVSLCADADQQNYFPENFRSEVFDDDYVGRVFAALCGPTQMQQVFGIGMFPKAVPRERKEFHVALKSVNPNYDPPYLAEGPFQGGIFLSRLIQYAGPNLTPQSVYNGTRSSVQIGGWSIANEWPGWRCCNPETPTYHVGVTPDSFTAKIDARQIYWDGSATSQGDGATGAWVGVDDSRRYRIGEWPPGEPRQP